jgi:hypothetical protein
VVSLQAELGAEVRRREAAEQQLECQIRRQTRPSMVYGQGPVAQNRGLPQPQVIAPVEGWADHLTSFAGW